jgi:predicted TIM-barrel fold metal-dependent hydrolase
MSDTFLGPIDCDVHQELRSADDDLYPYLSSGWQDFVRGYQRATGSVDSIAHAVTANPAYRLYASNPLGYDRKDAIPADGSLAGSSVELMVDQLLDQFGIRYAILTGGELPLGVSGHNNPYFGTEVARAFNDHQVEHWLDRDPRLLGSIALPLQVPDWAAKEIRRWHDEPRMVQTMACTNSHAHAFGHPIFDSVHRACAETGRPFAIHSLGDGAAGAVGPALAAGMPSMYMEFHVGALEGIISHLMSFIVHGVFDRYPDFRLVLVEGGVTWLPAFISRMDADFMALRREVPWCKQLPSEYLRERVMVTTQPLHVSGRDDPLIEAMDRLGMEDVLAFSSDYPHWDTDLPTYAISQLPASWRDKVMHDNAARMYGLSVPATV